MQLIIELVSLFIGLFCILYGGYSYKRKRVTLVNHTTRFGILWTSKMYLHYSDKKAQIISFVIICLGFIAILNFVLLVFGLVTYP